MLLLFSHELRDEQKQDIKENWNIEEYVSLPKNLQTLWSSIPPQLEDIEEYLKPIKAFLSDSVNRDDIVLVQGDFGATYSMIGLVKSLGAKAVYATTKREVIEKEIEGKVVKTSVFKHIRFRAY